MREPLNFSSGGIERVSRTYRIRARAARRYVADGGDDQLFSGAGEGPRGGLRLMADQ
jgi:hypothetical protein